VPGVASSTPLAAIVAAHARDRPWLPTAVSPRFNGLRGADGLARAQTCATPVCAGDSPLRRKRRVVSPRPPPHCARRAVRPLITRSLTGVALESRAVRCAQLLRKASRCYVNRTARAP
jgi:hypothetical protein